MSIILSLGRWGGVYVHYRGYTRRICLGWLAITFVPEDINVVLNRLIQRGQRGR